MSKHGSEIVRVLHRSCGVCGKKLFIMLGPGGNIVAGGQYFHSYGKGFRNFVDVRLEKKRLHWSVDEYWECDECYLDAEEQEKWENEQMLHRKTEDHLIFKKYVTSWVDVVKGFFGKPKRYSLDDVKEGK